ncbi:hypothetical protein Trydic_g7345 [Trypoxylus dichotomus]
MNMRTTKYYELSYSSAANIIKVDLNLIGEGNAIRSYNRGPRRRTTTYRSPPRYDSGTQNDYQNYNQPSYYQPSWRPTTPRYSTQTQQAYPSYNQPNYNPPHYNQPGYNQPGYNQPHYNQPSYNRPGYYQPGFPNNNYSPGMWTENKDHSVRNSVLAGLGGSALGLYLGYKLGEITNSNNGPNYISGTGGYPQYSVVHHYHQGDSPIPKNGKVEADVIKKCDNVTFCTPNTTPLCMNNGTVYCIASLESTIICNENSTEMKCINSTITLPCNANTTNCNSTSLNTTALSIPCVTTIDVFGDFASNKLSVNKISKRATEEVIATTMESILSSTGNNFTSETTTMDSTANDTSTTTSIITMEVPINISQTTNNSSSSITNHGISNKYCVTVIAEPIKEPVVPPSMSNEEFVKRGGGGSARRAPTRSPRRTTTYRSAQRVTTPRYNVQTQNAYPNYNQPSYNQPSHNQPQAAQRVTTPRYNIQTQQAYPSYNQPNYNQPGYNQPHYNQPGYNQPHYNQPGYNQPGYNQPHYNQPGYNQPGYHQPGFPNNNYSPGMWTTQNKDHSVRNSVLAGLGGSALGLYLGYKLGEITNSNNGPNYIGGAGGYPQYSVVHHYHHGDRPIPKDGKVEADVIKKCDNVTFCTPNTTPLCMNNGTVYCIASLESTIICNENSTEMKCINSTITLPCEANSTNCNSTSLNTTALSIPCVTTIDVFGDFASNKLSVNKISKRAAEEVATTTMESISSSTGINLTNETTTMNSTANDTSTTTSTTTVAGPASMSQTASNPSSSITSQGISNKYCVTVIAEPIKEPVVPPNMSNEEFVKYVESNNDTKAEIDSKLSDTFNKCKGGRGGGGRGGRGGRGKGAKSGGVGLRRGSSVTEGLTGSTLGFHLGHYIGRMKSIHNTDHNYGSGTHIYSVSHHYYKEDRSIPSNSNVDTKDLSPCIHITFCPPNSHPLCLTNGTVYCITPISMVSHCIVDSLPLKCVNTTLSAPCFSIFDSGCNNAAMIKNETAQIPCVTNLFVSGDFTGASLEKSITTMQMVERDLDEYCITVIADPLVDREDDNEIAEYVLGAVILMVVLGVLIHDHRCDKKKVAENNTENRL